MEGSLGDIEQLRHSLQIAEENHVGRGASDVGGRLNLDANGGLGNSDSVVGAIATEKDDLSGFLKAADVGLLAFRGLFTCDLRLAALGALPGGPTGDMA